MNRFVNRALLGVGLGILLYALWFVYQGIDDVTQALEGFSWTAVFVALGLSTINYFLRFLKWEFCLHWLNLHTSEEMPAKPLSRIYSLLIYLAGLSMSITPGKVGEVLRSWLLWSHHRISVARSAPIVVADRLTDFMALIVLSLIGVSQFRQYIPVVIVAFVLVILLAGVMASPRLLHEILRWIARLPWIGRFAMRADPLIHSSAELMRLPHLAILAGLSILGWGLECLGYYVILHGFVGVSAPLSLCMFLWAITTLIGALSFLPGGLGATEGSLALLAGTLVMGMNEEIAMASTVLIRACTLWYGTVVGGVILGVIAPKMTQIPKQQESA